MFYVFYVYVFYVKWLIKEVIRSTIPHTELKSGECVVYKVVGVEMSDASRRYKVRWLGYLGQVSWEREVNLAAAGARAGQE